MKSVKEYKQQIKLGVRVRATVKHARTPDPVVREGEVVKVQGKEFVILAPDPRKNNEPGRFWLRFPLVREARFEDGAIHYSSFASGGPRKGEIISTSTVEILEGK